MKTTPKPAAHWGTIGCMADPEIIARVETLASAQGMGKSGYVRRLILQHLAELDAGRAAA